jgi:hypothetical protein
MATLEYLSQGEARAVRELVGVALEWGAALSVYDGEEWTVKASYDEDTILAALGTTDRDILRVRHPVTRERVGDILLVYGNAPDGSEVVADHTEAGPIFDILEGAGLV